MLERLSNAGISVHKVFLFILVREMITVKKVCLVLLAATFRLPPALAADDSVHLHDSERISADLSKSAIAIAPTLRVLASSRKRANFGYEQASPQAFHVANWVVDSSDNAGMPFMIVDKVVARVLIFNARGQLQGAAPALLGLARGDDSAPDIGQRKLSSIRPDERTTPAGRFTASLGRDVYGKEMLWVDYDTAISLHPIVKGTPAERRSQRLNSPSANDNRISYGCINVPLKFYELLVKHAFTCTSGIVYILPETRTAQEVFGSYDVKNL